MAQLSEKQLVQAACSRHEGETPETLLSFKVYPTKVAIILSNGQKHEYGIADLVAWVKRPPSVPPPSIPPSGGRQAGGKGKAEAKAEANN